MSNGRSLNAERQRLHNHRLGNENWRLWGPYLSERAWGTVREDYSAYGDAWAFLPHDHARSRAYRWSEDGLGGISDENQNLCLALALWNGRDPFQKERAFGLELQFKSNLWNTRCRNGRTHHAATDPVASVERG